MYTVRQLPEFAAWLAGIRDGKTRLRLAMRLDKAQRGILGDVKAVGKGVCEMRESFGPEKSSQKADIATAIKRAATLEN